MALGLRWAQGQGQAHRGTRWHLVVKDLPVDSTGECNATVQKTACGHTIVQSDSIELNNYRMDYIWQNAWDVCNHCKEFSK